MKVEELTCDRVLIEYFRKLDDLSSKVTSNKKQELYVVEDIERKIQHVMSCKKFDFVKEDYALIFSDKDLAICFNQENDCVTEPFFYGIKYKDKLDDLNLVHITEVDDKNSDIYHSIFHGTHLPIDTNEFYIRLGNEQIVGGVQIDSKLSTICNIYILPEHRRCGYASALLRHEVSNHVMVMAYNLAGKQLLRNNGYILTEKPLFYVRRSEI